MSSNNNKKTIPTSKLFYLLHSTKYETVAKAQSYGEKQGWSSKGVKKVIKILLETQGRDTYSKYV